MEHRRLFAGAGSSDRLPPGELDRQFELFGEEAARFARGLATIVDFTEGGDRALSADRTLRATRAVFGKWSIEILVLLYTMKELGFEQIRRHLAGISGRSLSQKLRSLESRGMLVREVVSARPPRVLYRLSPRGETLAKIGEPVILYLRFFSGEYSGSSAADFGAAFPSAVERVPGRSPSATVVRSPLQRPRFGGT